MLRDILGQLSVGTTGGLLTFAMAGWIPTEVIWPIVGGFVGGLAAGLLLMLVERRAGRRGAGRGRGSGEVAKAEGVNLDNGPDGTPW